MLFIDSENFKMVHDTTAQSFTLECNCWPTGTLEHFIHSCWQLGMMRFHTFTNECGKELQDTYNLINYELGARVEYIDLALIDEDYRDKSQILDIIRSDEPTWVWFINCNALLNSSLAGWLRSMLTTYNVVHIRATFVLDNRDQFQRVFQSYTTPLYQSTMALRLIKGSL
ncbi:hypothetical protein BCU33_005575 [Vibrio lentus]|uniref:hypothetical protein n=1 Tax=Vibrio lentus TaxID=136468 RepID=UPI001F1FE01D|nr:hypothetical protein [Vibrio lentus]